MPFNIQKGETAPGKTPKCWNNLSGEPKERRLDLIFSLSLFCRLMSQADQFQSHQNSLLHVCV